MFPNRDTYILQVFSFQISGKVTYFWAWSQENLVIKQWRHRDWQCLSWQVFKTQQNFLQTSELPEKHVFCLFVSECNEVLIGDGFCDDKVRIFWEGHKIRKKLPLKIWRYWVTSNFKWKIFSNFVAFSEYPNFNMR